MKQWWLWVLTGAVSMLGGLAALCSPFISSLVATQLTGWSFFIVGVLVLAAVFRSRDAASNWPALALGAAMLLLSVFLIARPLAGLVSLSVVVAAAFIVSGLARMGLALRTQGAPRTTLLVSGVLSTVLGVMIFSQFPLSVLVLLGVLMGVELLGNGLSLVLMGLMQKGAGQARDDMALPPDMN